MAVTNFGKGDEYQRQRQRKGPTGSEIATWLDWAGAKLLALGLPGAGPAGYRSYWPDYAANRSAAYGYTRETLRAPKVAPEEVTMMDAILHLPALIPDIRTRCIVHRRLLVTPVSDRRVNSFGKIAREFHIDARLAARLYYRGLAEIAQRASQAQTSSIQQFFHRANNRP